MRPASSATWVSASRWTTRPRFHANDISRDVLNVVPRAVEIEDARQRKIAPRSTSRASAWCRHASAVRDFRDRGRDRARTRRGDPAIAARGLRRRSCRPSPAAGVLRFGERSGNPARTTTRDRRASCTWTSAMPRRRRSTRAPARTTAARVRRSAQYNVWRVLTPPPQDVPLAVCDARSLAPEDFIPADAIFDKDGAIAFYLRGVAAAAQSAAALGCTSRTCDPTRR